MRNIIKLHIKQPDKESEIVSLETGQYTIGRSKENEVVISNDTVSRVHAEITISEDSASLKKLQTSSDIWVNGEICTDLVELHDNSIIMLGLVKVKLEAPFLIDDEISDNGETRIFKVGELAAVLEEIINTDATDNFDESKPIEVPEKTEHTTIAGAVDEVRTDITRILDRQTLQLDNEVCIGRLVLLNSDYSNDAIEYVLYEGENTIGRDTGCDIVLLDKMVSRMHAAITVSKDAIQLNDLGSYNGVTVDGVKVTGLWQLKDQEQITLGGESYRFIAPQSVCVIDGPQRPKRSLDNKIAEKWARGQTSLKKAVSVFMALETPKKIIAVLCFFIVLLCGYVYFPINQQEAKVVKSIEEKKTSSQTAVAEKNPEKKVVETSANFELEMAFAKAQKYADNELWEQANILLAEIGEENANYPGLKELLTLTTEEMENEKAFFQGTSYKREGRNDEAVQSFKSIEASSLYFARAQKELLLLSQNQEAAVAEVEQSASPVKEEPQETLSADILDYIVTFYINGEFDKAIAVVHEHTTEDGGPQELKDAGDTVLKLYSEFGKGFDLYKKGKVTAAFKVWEEVLVAERLFVGNRTSTIAIEIQNTKTQYYYQISKKSLKKGQYKKANTYCLKTLALDAEHEGALKIASQLNARAKTLYEKGYVLEDLRHDKALKLWREVLEISPPFTVYHKKAKRALERF